MTEDTQNQEKTSGAEALQEAAKGSDTKAEATDTSNASDELSEDDLEAVAGGAYRAIETRYETITTNILKD